MDPHTYHAPPGLTERDVLADVEPRTWLCACGMVNCEGEWRCYWCGDRVRGNEQLRAGINNRWRKKGR